MSAALNTTKMVPKGNLLPAYEHLCDECACRFEKRQKMSDGAIDHCPECGGRVKRLISGGAGAITKSASQRAEPACATGACCGGGTCGRGMFCEN